MSKCNHQWDYIGNQRLGESIIMVENPYYAVWICPKCDEKKLTKFEDGRTLI